MAKNVKDQGNYELFETAHQHRILVLNGKKWYAWMEGQEGEILVHSDSDHQKDHTIQQGAFYLVGYENDPDHRDMPHLFLGKDDTYQELILPNGLPTEEDHQKKVIKTDQTLPKQKLEQELKG